MDTNPWDDTALIKAYDEALDGARQLSLKAGSTAATSWKVGDVCRCRWSEDGVIYNAVVDEIDTAADTCTITYTDYGNMDTVKTSALLQPHTKSKQKKRAAQEHAPAPASAAAPAAAAAPAPAPAAAATTTTTNTNTSWNAGDRCTSVHCADGNTYPAVVETISHDARTCTVVFDATGSRQYETPLDALQEAAADAAGTAGGGAGGGGAAGGEGRRAAPNQKTDDRQQQQQQQQQHQANDDGGGPWAAEWAEYYARLAREQAPPPPPPPSTAASAPPNPFSSPSRRPSASRPTAGMATTPQSQLRHSSLYAPPQHPHSYYNAAEQYQYRDSGAAYARPPPPQSPAAAAAASSSPLHAPYHQHHHQFQHHGHYSGQPPPPHTPSAAAAAAPPPPHFPSYPPGMPLPANEQEESLANMLMAWYQSGFQTGYYVGLSRR